jgi:formiminotetrahydrofolate cyclodeaminase
VVAAKQARRVFPGETDDAGNLVVVLAVGLAAAKLHPRANLLPVDDQRFAAHLRLQTQAVAHPTI